MPPRKKFVWEMPEEITQNRCQARSALKITNDSSQSDTELVTSTSAKKQNQNQKEALENPSPNDPETIAATKPSNQYQNQQEKSEDSSSSEDVTLAISTIQRKRQQPDQLNKRRVKKPIINDGSDNNEEGQTSKSVNISYYRKKMKMKKGKYRKDLGSKSNALQLQKYPKQFQNISNEFDIALWVAQHERILDLAITIRNAMSIPVNEEESKVSQTPMMPNSISHQMSSTLSKIEND